MNFFNLFRKQPKKLPPSPFETMAAFSRFQNVQECSPDFYQKHIVAIDMTVGFIGFLGEQHPHFRQIFTCSAAPVADAARILESSMRSMKLDQNTIDFIDSTMTGIMQKLYTVVTDRELPPYLKDCIWPIVGAFEE